MALSRLNKAYTLFLTSNTQPAIVITYPRMPVRKEIGNHITTKNYGSISLTGQHLLKKEGMVGEQSFIRLSQWNSHNTIKHDLFKHILRDRIWENPQVW